MKSKNTLFGIVLTVALLVSMAAPALGATAVDGGLSVAVDQGEDVVVTVTSDVAVNNTTTTTAVENATVTVNALNNSTYAAGESYVTDENGTVILPDPQENVTVEVTATWNGSTSTTTVELLAANESEDEETTQDPYTFGQRMADYIHQFLHTGDVDGPLGQLISEFARSNNPGADNRAEQAENAHEKKQGEEKRNEHAKKGREKHNEHAKNKGKHGHEETETTESDETTEAETAE